MQHMHPRPLCCPHASAVVSVRRQGGRIRPLPVPSNALPKCAGRIFSPNADARHSPSGFGAVCRDVLVPALLTVSAALRNCNSPSQWQRPCSCALPHALRHITPMHFHFHTVRLSPAIPIRASHARAFAGVSARRQGGRIRPLPVPSNALPKCAGRIFSPNADARHSPSGFGAVCRDVLVPALLTVSAALRNCNSPPQWQRP